MDYKKHTIKEDLLETTPASNSLITDPTKNSLNNESAALLIVGCALVVLILVAIFLLVMVYCYMKQNSSHKPKSGDLALSTNLSNLNQLDLNNNNNTNSSNSSNSSSNLNLSTSGPINKSQTLTNLSSSNESLNTVSKLNFKSKTSTSGYSSSNSSCISSNCSKGRLSLSMPIAKPQLNELKPQLSIESNMKMKLKTKSLIERRGSNNSLTLSLNTTKKKLLITNTNPSKESNTVDFLSKQSRLLTVNELVRISKSNASLYNEFYFLPFNHSETCVPSSGIKNRYKTIVPNESSRVTLAVSSDQHQHSSYINANYISGYKCESKAYIATQGPMSNTIDDLWRMVWHERVSCIVMITKLVERNKNKCELYFSEEQGVSIDYDGIVVTVKNLNYFQDYEVRELKIEHNNETRFVYHYWYTAWQDHNLPENPDALLELIMQVESDRKFDDGIVKGPVLVHCSAGVGRTGCFLALSIGIKQIDLNNFVDIVKIVCNLRIDRGGMIQTLEQYEFIYQVLAYYCIYYKKYPFSSSPSLGLDCLRSPISTTFFFNTQ